MILTHISNFKFVMDCLSDSRSLSLSHLAVRLDDSVSAIGIRCFPFQVLVTGAMRYPISRGLFRHTEIESSNLLNFVKLNHSVFYVVAGAAKQLHVFHDIKTSVGKADYMVNG